VIQEASVSTAWLSFEDVPLKWHYPIGLLYDLFSGASPAHAEISSVGRNRSQSQNRSPSGAKAAEAQQPLPWSLILHFSDFPDSLLVRLDTEGRVIHDAFINSVKEADFLRNGSANAIMKLSKDDSTRLWNSVENYDQPTFFSIQNKLLPSSSELRNIPFRVYLPATSPTTVSSPPTSPPPASYPGSPATNERKSDTTTPSHLKVVQPLVTAVLPQTRSPQTVGTALHAALPSLFPSRKTPIQAYPVLHGAVLPMTAPLDEVLRASAYMDGWLHLGIEMHG
jgi:autophagy-related protein 5